MTAFAFPNALFSPLTRPRTKKQSSFLPNESCARPTARVSRHTWRRCTHVITAKTGVDPTDEAFVNCGLCGSDEIVSASEIVRKGSTSVTCSQCKARFTARADDAMTSMGAPLVDPDATPAAGDGTSESTQTVGVKLYVSGLGPKVNEAALKTALEEFGEVRDAVVIFDRKTGRSRGFGFVTVVGKSAAAAAMDVLTDSSSTLGSRVKVREAIDR